MGFARPEMQARRAASTAMIGQVVRHLAAGKDEAVVEIFEGAIELGFEAGVEQGLEVRTGIKPEFDQMPPEDDRFGRLAGQGHLIGVVEQPLTRGKAVERQGRTPLMIGPGNPDETVDSTDATRQPPDRQSDCGGTRDAAL